ncbi:MAG: hypothetical protein LR015_12655 [Verrucomicrobia bacterium]|nr:hypothetical protein [Verrucomicrobiota bacterium]
MELVFQPSRQLHDLLLKLASEVSGFDDSFDPQIRPADPRFGDWQANGVLAFAKQQRANPRALASALQEAWLSSTFHRKDWVDVSIAGPGFINFKFTPAYHWLGWKGSGAVSGCARGQLPEPKSAQWWSTTARQILLKKCTLATFDPRLLARQLPGYFNFSDTG